MKKRSLWLSAAGSLVVAVALAGCGTTTYFAGRVLPPSGLQNRVLITIQNPSSSTKGALNFVDAFYDIRYAYNNVNKTFSISGFSGALPTTIQNMPEEELGAVYGSGDGSFTLINYAKEATNGAAVTNLNPPCSSVFITRNQAYVFCASQQSHVLTVVNKNSGQSYPLNLPGAYRVSVNPGGSVALAFVQNSNYMYYVRQLTAQQTIAYSGGSSTWPLGAQDCEPQNAPGWCIFQALDPSSTSGNLKPLTFDRPVKAVFSGDGGTAYVLNCGPECGGTNASVSLVPTAPIVFLSGQASGTLPTASALAADCSATPGASSCTLAVPGGASNALVNSSTMYVAGQQPAQDGLFTGNLTVVNLSPTATSTLSASSSAPISDGAPGAVSKMNLGDDNTLWIGMTKCNNGARYATGQAFGCLTMYNTSTNTVTMLEPYLGDATGIAAVTGLHKVYVVQGGQVYIYSTVDGSSINNQYVTVTGTAYDVAFMDAHTDANNTVY
ncbi:MAG: hypothetical protein WB608_05100 [Terracidiphilus sp.]